MHNTAVKWARRARANEYIYWQPRANFPRKNVKGNMGNNRCHAEFTKKKNCNVHRNLLKEKKAGKT